jgi:hypothetical protein
MHFSNAGGIGTENLWHWLTSEFALHPAMRFWPGRSFLDQEFFPRELTGGVVGQRKSDFCQHQKNIIEQV